MPSIAQLLLHLLVPKSAPLTVTLPPDVAPSFAHPTLDGALPSYDTTTVTDPTRSPDVMETTTLPYTPALVVHTTDVSDTQPVACAPDWPARICPLYLLHQPHTLHTSPSAHQ